MPNTAFESSYIEIGENNIFFRRYGKGPAILMVHGFPRTSLMWRHLKYRAATTIDVEHDQLDKKEKKQIQCPMLHLWAEGGPLDTFYAEDGGPLGIWRQWAPRAYGQAMRGGHFLPEENPEDTATLLREFLKA